MNMRELSKQIRNGMMLAPDSKKRQFTGRLLLGALLFALSLSVVSAQPTGLRIVSSVDKTTSISQYGITWYFDGEVEYGRYVTGDYWVVGPVTIVDIDPESYSSTQASVHRTSSVTTRYLNGSMINPRGGVNVTGFDNGGRSPGSGGYSHEHNVSWGLDEENPLELSAGDSLLSSVSRYTFTSGPPLLTVAVLTVVDQPPPEGSFRPPYVGHDKTIKHNIEDVESNINRLQNLDIVGNPRSWETVHQEMQRPVIDFWHEWTRSNITPLLNNDSYGREFNQRHGAAILMLNMNYSEAQKMPVLISVVQRGIDLYSIYKDAVDGPGDFPWPPNGGHAHGRFWPILFAGYMLNDPDMMNIGETNDFTYEGGDEEHGAKIGTGRRFQENAQTFYVRPYDVERQDMIDHGRGSHELYQDEHVGMPEWGIRHWVRPWQDSADWSFSYRRNENGSTYQAVALAAMAMGLRQAWNNDAFFDYTDRHMTIASGDGWYNDDGAHVEVPNETTGWRCWPAYEFACDMWDEHRGAY